MGYVIAAAVGYLLGSSNMAFYLSKIKRVDIQSRGSGNLGASNTTAVFGWAAGILVAVHDVLKAVLAVTVTGWLFPELPNAGLVAGVASVLGHIFPFYLKFKGGKGFASFWGMTLALNWKLALIIAVGGVLITLLTDYIALATTMTALTVPLYLGFEGHDLIPPMIVLIATAVILWKHRDNYVRILKGQEMGLRSVARGEHRTK